MVVLDHMAQSMVLIEGTPPGIDTILLDATTNRSWKVLLVSPCNNLDGHWLVQLSGGQAHNTWFGHWTPNKKLTPLPAEGVVLTPAEAQP